MRGAAGIFRILFWIVLVLVVAIQIVTMVSIQMNNANAVEAGQHDKVLSIVPLAAATVLMVAGAVLFEAVSKRRYIGLILCAVAGVVFFLYAFSIRDAFPVRVGSWGQDAGVSTARMIWRHMSPVLVPVLMLGAWLSERSAAKRQPISDKTGFDLSGGPLFRDEGRSHTKAEIEAPAASPSDDGHSGRGKKRE